MTVLACVLTFILGVLSVVHESMKPGIWRGCVLYIALFLCAMTGAIFARMLIP